MTCLDAKTGEVKYEGGRVPVPATFMASPVAFDGKILLFSEDGDTFVLKAGPEARGAAHEPAGRADLRDARARERPHLHPRRRPRVRHRQVLTGRPRRETSTGG